MERRVGEVFEYNGVPLIAIENSDCEGCFFNSTTDNTCTKRITKMLSCSGLSRKDNKSVIFKKWEKEQLN